MKILAFKDKQLDDITPMLGSLKEDYQGVTDVEWTIEEINADLPWQVYSGDDRGLDKQYVARECAKLWDEHGYEYDHVIWFFSRESWDAPGIGGWNLGRLYSNYAVQLVLAEQSGKWAGKTLKMEAIHAMDELAPVELGINLDRMRPIDGEYLDWDIERVHGEHERYGVKQSDGTYFTDYDYTTLIDDFSSVISSIYEERRRKYKVKRISLLKQLVRLYRKLLQLNNQPTAAPLQGKKHHNHEH